MADNKRITELPVSVTIGGVTWHRTSQQTQNMHSYSWAQGASSAVVDQAFIGGSPAHFTVVPSQSGWVNDIHYSDGGSRIYYFRPKTPFRSRSCGWGDHVPQTSPHRNNEAGIKSLFRDLLTAFGMAYDQLLQAPQPAPVTPPALPKFTQDDFPALGT